MTLNIRRCCAASTVLAACTLSACGGGGDSGQSYERFTQSQEAMLDGDWATQPQSVVAKDVTTWRALWQERRAAIDCTQAYNQPACNAPEPPSVDFTKYAVAGGFAGNSCTFRDPDHPARVFTEANPDQLVVDVDWRCASGLGFGGPRVNFFVLVHQTDLTIVVR